jgi:RND superfamily putative drug exporter
MRRLAGWCVEHRRIVLAAWVAMVIGLTAIHAGAGSAYKDTFKLRGTESSDALALLKRSAPKASGDTVRVVVATKTAKLTDAPVRSRVDAMLARTAKLPSIAAVGSPYAGSGQVSRDGRVGFAVVTLDDQAVSVPVGDIKRLVRTARAVGGNGLQVELSGQAIEFANRRGAGGTGIGVIAAALVLLLVFGSLAATALPLLCTGFALGTAISVIGLLTHAIQVASFAEQLSLLIGLGVGVDYALFIVTRYRQGLMRGRPRAGAIADAVDTAGRAVFFAGITVCIALLGMFALGVSFLYGVAIAASIAVAFTVLAALTLLPAFLGFFGDRVLTRRQRRALAAGDLALTDESPGWARWARRLQDRPALAAVAAAAFMLVLAIPMLGMRLGSSDQGSDPTDTTTRKAYDLLAKGFGPGFSGPLQLVAEARTPAQQADVRHVVAAAAELPDVAATTRPVALGSSGIMTAQVVPRGSPQDASTTDLLNHLRDEVVPSASRGTRVLVGGQTAIFEDFSHVLARKLPFFIGVVVGLSFLLLLAVFRSLVIPATAAVMNLLSVGAAFGIVTAIFQWGWLSGVIGISRTGPIEAFLPVMVFAIVFGLSMDYEVFLVSRIYEEWHRRGDNREAIAHGLAATGRTITAAAAIMVLVFAAFVLGGERVIKLFGVSLASAVLLDALVVRSILLPGLMLVIGKANWALPRRVERALPRLNVEGSAAEEGA